MSPQDMIFGDLETFLKDRKAIKVEQSTDAARKPQRNIETENEKLLMRAMRGTVAALKS